MNRETKLTVSGIALMVIFLLAGARAQIRGQNPAPQNPVEPAQTQNQTQVNQAPDFAFLNLSPDQIQKIRAINLELRDQRQAANQKLRQAQRALTEAIESPTPDEALIDQRSRDVAAAQATTIRLRSLTEARILQVLTPEQRIRLRDMRQKNQAARRQANQQFPVTVLPPRRQGNVNGLGPNQKKQLRNQPKH